MKNIFFDTLYKAKRGVTIDKQVQYMNFTIKEPRFSPRS
jgi:hypothetical protein